jgi:hypothetical protein
MAPVVELKDCAAAVKLPASTTRANTRMFCKVSIDPSISRLRQYCPLD